MYLGAPSAGGQEGVRKALSIMREEIIRDMKLMGISTNELNGSMLSEEINFNQGNKRLWFQLPRSPL